MNMTALLDLLDQKVLATSFSALFGIYLVLRKHHLQIRQQNQKEIKLIEKLTKNIAKNAHPLIIEKQYAAITVDSRATAAEISFLLGLPSPTGAIRKFSKTRKFIEIALVPSTGAGIRFKKKFLKSRRRTISKWLNGTAYAVFGFATISPIIFMKTTLGFISNISDVTPILAFSAWCALIALGSLDDAVKLKIAEDFMLEANQPPPNLS